MSCHQKNTTVLVTLNHGQKMHSSISKELMVLEMPHYPHMSDKHLKGHWATFSGNFPFS